MFNQNSPKEAKQILVEEPESKRYTKREKEDEKEITIQNLRNQITLLKKQNSDLQPKNEDEKS